MNRRPFFFFFCGGGGGKKKKKKKKICVAKIGPARVDFTVRTRARHRFHEPATASGTRRIAGNIIRTNIPARLDRLPWSRFHWRVVIGLGTVWILDGLQVTIVGAIGARLTEHGSGIHLSAPASAPPARSTSPARASARCCSANSPTATAARSCSCSHSASTSSRRSRSAFAFAPWYFFLFRFITGMGIGGEYAAINSAIDELIPARNRGRVDLAINGSYWVGSAVGGLAALVLLDTALLAEGRRLAAGVRARRRPRAGDHAGPPPRSREPPLAVHPRPRAGGRADRRSDRGGGRARTGVELPDPDDEITVRQREAIPFRELARVAITRYPRRGFLGLALFVGQAFLYNAVVFDLGTLLHEFFAVGSGSVPYYMAIFAISNFLGPLLLGRFFDTIGRIPMISGTYLASAGWSWRWACC